MRVLVLGAGSIGSCIARVLSRLGYARRVVVADIALQTRASGISYVDPREYLDWKSLIEHTAADVVINALPHTHNLAIVRAVLDVGGVHYLDLTEDVATSRFLRAATPRGATFAPHCGLAPGLICIVGADLMSQFDETESLELRVGALPRFVNNDLGYAVNWSIDGLLNEYVSPVEVISQGERRVVEALSSLEKIVIDGRQYEAFATSGGLGTMTDSLEGRVGNLSYKSVRYPGHRERWLEVAIADRRAYVAQHCPPTDRDAVVLFARAVGTRAGARSSLEIAWEWRDGRVMWPLPLEMKAIQLTTAMSCVAVFELLARGALATGVVRQESIGLDAFKSTEAGATLFGAVKSA